jgi:ribonucleoside-diphosphate reductase alpha chain
LPIDTARSQSTKADWDIVRERLKKFGIRNSNIMAIAPTATISIITNTTPCIEPLFEVERFEGNMSGKFKVIDPCLKHGNDHLLKTVWEIDTKWIIAAAAVRQKWIDQSQSVNIFVKAGTKGRDLADIYFSAWEQGLKTTYYLRSQSKTAKAAPKPEAAPVEAPVEFCSIDNPDCEACQ